MNQLPTMSFEERMEREVAAIHRKMDCLLQAMRVLGQALSVTDRLEQLLHSLSQPPTDPAE